MEIEQGISYLKESDPVIKKLIETLGPCSLQKSSDYYKDIIRNIISQQLSVKAASTIKERFRLLVGTLHPIEVLKYSISDFRAIGVSSQKAKYILELSEKIVREELTLNDLDMLSDEDVVKKLVSIKGVGTWTAQMLLIFSLNRLNILPLEDVGFQRAVSRFYNIEKSSFITRIEDISSRWGNYRTIAVWYLWEGLDSNIS